MDFNTFYKPFYYRFSQIKGLAKSKASKNSLIIFSGNVVNSLLSLAAIILVSRALGPANFGILAVYSSIIVTLLGLTDFGLGTTAIKLISSSLEKNHQKTVALMKVIFKLEIAGGILIGISGLLFSSLIANLLGGQQFLFAVRMAFLASIFTSAGAFVGPFFAAYEKFLKNAIVSLFANVAKILGVLILFKLGSLHLNNILVLYTLIAIFAFFVGLYFAPRGYLEKTTKSEEKKAFGEIFHFSKWVLLSYVASVIAGKMDIFLLAGFKGNTEVGLYAAGQQLASIMPLMIGAISTVLLPRVSKMKTSEEFRSYFKKVILGASILVVFLLPALLFGDFFIELIFGSRFASSVGTFKILFTAYLIALIANPLSLVIYALNKPKIFTFINYIQLALTLVLNLLLIPVIGKTGAATTFLISTLFGSILSIVFSLRLVKKLKENTYKRQI